jgi:basic membrane protein A
MRSKQARISTVLAAAAALAALAAGCGSDDTDANGSSDAGASSDGVKVALVETGPKDDGGWNSSFLRAMDQMKTLAPDAQTTIVANVEPGSQGQTTIDTLASQGYGLVVLNGNFANDLGKVAPKYPDVKFLSQYDDIAQDNRAPFSTADEIGGYLIGMLAGLSTESGTIGSVGNYAEPGNQRVLNGIMLGAKSVRPDAEIRRLLVNSYYDPTKERQAAEALADAGADVRIQDNASPATASVAEKRALKYVGWANDRRQQAQNAWLGGFVNDWAPIIADAIGKVADGTWKPDVVHGVEEPTVELLPFGDSVPQDVRKQIEEAHDKLVSGEMHVYEGPIKDTSGKVVVAEGETIEDAADLNTCCDWLVEGIQGQD